MGTPCQNLQFSKKQLTVMVGYVSFSLREPWLVGCINVARLWYLNIMSNNTLDLPMKDKQLKLGFRER